MITTFLQFAFMGFWHFIGALILASLVISGIIKALIWFLRFLTVTFRGWPPSHLDVNGNWKPIEKVKK